MSEKVIVKIIAVLLLPFVLLALCFYGTYKLLLYLIEFAEAGSVEAFEMLQTAVSKLKQELLK